MGVLSQAPRYAAESTMAVTCIFYAIHLDLLKYTMTVPDPDGENSVLSEMQADMLLVLSCVCDMDMHRKVGG